MAKGWYNDSYSHSIAGHKSNIRKSFNLISHINVYNKLSMQFVANNLLDAPNQRKQFIENIKKRSGDDYLKSLSAMLHYHVITEYKYKGCLYEDEEHCEYKRLLDMIDTKLTEDEKVNLFSDLILVKRGDILLDYIYYIYDDTEHLKEFLTKIVKTSISQALLIFMTEKTSSTSKQLKDKDIGFIVDSINLFNDIAGIDFDISGKVVSLYKDYKYLQLKYDYQDMNKHLNTLYDSIRNKNVDIDKYSSDKDYLYFYIEPPFIDDIKFAKYYLHRNPQDITIMYIASVIDELNSRRYDNKSPMIPYLNYTLFNNSLYDGYDICLSKLSKLYPDKSNDELQKIMFNDIIRYIGYILKMKSRVLETKEEFSDFSKSIGALLYYLYDITGNDEYINIGKMRKTKLIPSNSEDDLRTGLYSTMFKFGEISEEELLEVI